MTGVLIRGDGVAARCCAHLLARSGFRVSFELTNRPRVPAIMLGEQAQQLIRDVFGRERLFRGLPQIRKRIVSWGGAWGPHANAGPIELDHSAVVVSEEFLLDHLGIAAFENEGGESSFTICASTPLPAAVTEHRFGSRMASATPVQLKATAEPDACWIESLLEGWLFLITEGPGSAWLLSVGHHPRELLGHSRLIAEQIAAVDSAAGVFAASPRIATPLGGAGWLACGTAAMAFDPLCGDGTAHAVREAILASAVIGAAARGEDPHHLLSHYEARLIAGFQRHLVHCLQYYAAGRGNPWWDSEAASLTQGLDWCGRRMDDQPRFRYQLNGFELRMIE